jgi:NAD(P)-dependent dehydrogenase (short-subunit alcohol dehydrogenase family)
MVFEPSFPPRAIIIGSSGGLGAALARHLTLRGFAVTGLSRSPRTGAAVAEASIDLGSEESIEAAANRLRDRAPYQLIIVATGLLHDDDIVPEKTYRDLDQASLLKYFAINAAGPALVAKHFIPLLPRNGRCLFAALSARVGSIGDNRLGGWYGYRAAKAALNMLIKTLAIEVSRTRPEAICVGLHPGTVDTRLSKPFQKGIAADRLFSADQAAERLLDVIEGLAPAQSGKCFAWDGEEIGP